jgi:hypothetical protein
VIDTTTGDELHGITLTHTPTQMPHDIRVVAGPGASSAARKRLAEIY